MPFLLRAPAAGGEAEEVKLCVLALLRLELANESSDPDAVGCLSSGDFLPVPVLAT